MTHVSEGCPSVLGRAGVVATPGALAPLEKVNTISLPWFAGYVVAGQARSRPNIRRPTPTRLGGRVALPRIKVCQIANTRPDIAPERMRAARRRIAKLNSGTIQRFSNK